jgi:peptidoglycan L-alanyl-D-glutamate endopeptidase CwlK
MSAPLSREDILFRQRLLKAEGYYTGKLDGVWGPKIDAAAHGFDMMQEHIDALHRVDGRSLTSILTLALPMQEKACQIIDALNYWRKGVVAKVVSGTRTYAEQDALYAQGRTLPGKIITHASAGQSGHNFGIAIDIALWLNGALSNDDALYKAAGEYVMSALKDIEWGGNWSPGKVDYPHYQLATGLSVHEIRRRFEIGAAYFGGG